VQDPVNSQIHRRIIAQTIEKLKKTYYTALQSINESNEITNWLSYVAETVLEAQRTTLPRVEFVIAKTKLFDQLGEHLNDRQTKAIRRLFEAGPNGFIGGMSAKNYIAITQTSRATATRDLSDLLRKNVLTKTGELKHTRYYLNYSLAS